MYLKGGMTGRKKKRLGSLPKWQDSQRARQPILVSHRGVRNPVCSLSLLHPRYMEKLDEPWEGRAWNLPFTVGCECPKWQLDCGTTAPALDAALWSTSCVFFISLLFLSFVLLHHFKNSEKGHYFTLLPIWNAGSHYLLPCPKQKAAIGSETETQTQVLHTGSGFPGSGLATRPMPSPCSGVMKILG